MFTYASHICETLCFICQLQLRGTAHFPTLFFEIVEGLKMLENLPHSRITKKYNIFVWQAVTSRRMHLSMIYFNDYGSSRGRGFLPRHSKWTYLDDHVSLYGHIENPRLPRILCLPRSTASKLYFWRPAGRPINLSGLKFAPEPPNIRLALTFSTWAAAGVGISSMSACKQSIVTA